MIRTFIFVKMLNCLSNTYMQCSNSNFPVISVLLFANSTISLLSRTFPRNFLYPIFPVLIFFQNFWGHQRNLSVVQKSPSLAVCEIFYPSSALFNKWIRLDNSRSKGKHSTSPRVFLYTSFVLYRLPCALQQHRAQSRLVYLLNKAELR